MKDFNLISLLMKLQDLHFKMLVKTRLDNTFCFVVYSVYIPLAKYLLHF